MAAVARLISQGAVLGWGAGLIGSSITPRYLYPWYADQLAEVGELSLVAPQSGILRNFRVRQNIPGGNGNPITYTVFVSGVATPIAVTLQSTALAGSNLVNSFSVATGDRISVRATKSLGISDSPRGIVTTIDLM